MKKIRSFLLIMVVLFSITFPVFAENIDMNLSLNLTTNEENNYSTENSNNTATDNASTNTISNTYTPSTTTPKVSTINQVENSSLGFTNILNIVLLVIGILLVLLSIAILIRLK